ncbi:peptidase domain-containing ABC transporter [Methylovirgula sp. HY1]|uniref:peptidase domain-containing ABC transporter n=1 Tax=Methylovirgula sp. HY1 TaxID=2822761 RepID=UPI001C5BF538|nr:peptidase domain-containing ABC transporter [Methylovirgula sp. HY1]QXX74011.1 Toxin RTX-I translocation ATP-binding protein [Methylovirgula sp. HY1]
MRQSWPLQFGFRPRLPIILQSEAAECGLACLAMILGFHGHPIDLGSLRRRHSVSLKGTSLRHLMSIATTMGLSTRALRLDLDDLSRLRLPCILHWDLNHFVVLARVGRKGVTIHDPVSGRRHLPWQEVSRRFTGIALEASPSSLFERKDDRESLRLYDLFRNVTGIGGALTNVLLLSLGIEMAALLIPIASQIIIDEVIVNADQDLLIVVAVGLALLLVVQLAIGLARGWAIMLMGTRISLQWSASLFDHLMKLPLDYFEARHVGDIISRFGALTAIQKSITTDLVQTILDGFLAVGMLVMLFLYGGWLGFVALATVAINAAVRAIAFASYREASDEAVVNEAKQQTHFIETIRGIASVKLLGLAERRRNVWINHFVESMNAHLKLQRFDLLFSRANEFLFGADRVILLVLGAGLVIENRMTLGMLVAFLAYKDMFATRVGKLINSAFHLRTLNVQTERLADIVLAEATDATVGRDYLPAASEHSEGVSLVAEAVSLRYGESEAWIFRDADLVIEAGQCCAITGPSGCGKTSLLKVLMGLLAPTEGAVLIDGSEIRTLSAASRRRCVAGVLQDDGLFAGSIADNICGFDEQPNLADIEESAACAAILDDIRRMPMGFETFVGDMGSTLSGGQKQRIVLARALYQKPRILFLDEATSHLDEPTEAAIAATLRDLKMTRIIIAHRPATVAHADVTIPFAVLGQAKPGLRGAMAQRRGV